MDLVITEEQRSLLQEVLDATFRDLRAEITNTDNSTYKRDLRDRETQLRSLLDLVGGPLPDRG